MLNLLRAGLDFVSWAEARQDTENCRECAVHATMKFMQPGHSISSCPDA